MNLAAYITAKDAQRAAKRPIRIEGDIAFVPLTKGYEAVIDAADVPLIDGRNWRAQFLPRKHGALLVYAVSNVPRVNGYRYAEYMHRVILNPSNDKLADHIDGDGLNNRRSNLRSASRAQNAHNSRHHITTKSGQKGVFWRDDIQKFEAHIRSGKRRVLGYFNSLDDATAAYAKASADLHGDFGEGRMMDLTAFLNRKDDQRNLFFCPCCRDRLDASDMDLSSAWEHSQAMRDHYGAACCNACTDDHILTADGVLMRYADAVQGFDYTWSSQEAFDDAKWRGRE
jgi:hypothetical protein